MSEHLPQCLIAGPRHPDDVICICDRLNAAVEAAAQAEQERRDLGMACVIVQQPGESVTLYGPFDDFLTAEEFAKWLSNQANVPAAPRWMITGDLPYPVQKAVQERLGTASHIPTNHVALTPSDG